MKNKILGMFLLVSVVAGLSACSGKGASDDECIDDVTSAVCKDKQDLTMDDPMLEDDLSDED